MADQITVVGPDGQNKKAEFVYIGGSTGGGGAATIADGADVTQGAVADAAYITGSGTVVSVLKGIFGMLRGAGITGSGAVPGTQANPLYVGGEALVPTVSFTRPADTTAYAIGDLVANSTTAGSVVPLTLTAARNNAGVGEVRRIRLATTKTGLAGTEIFRVHLFKNIPTVTNGDNGAFAPQGITAIFIGYCDVTMAQIYSDGCKGIGVPATGSGIIFDTGASVSAIYALIEARSAYTPISGEVFTVAAEVVG